MSSRCLLRLHVQNAVLAVALCALSVSPARADEPCGTVVPPGLVKKTVWTAAGSPYCLTGDIDVADLTIEPGVCVLVDGPFRVRVLIKLIVNGEACAPVVFAPKDADVAWKGIQFDNEHESVLTHCHIEGSNERGLEIIDSTPELVECVISGNSTTGSGGGVYAEIGNGDLRLVGCEITGNTAVSHGGGLRTIGSNGFKLILDGCTITDNTSNPTNADRRGNVGGGLYATGDVELIDTRIGGNACFSSACGNCCGVTVRSRGGGVYLADGNVSFVRCIVSNNRARSSESGPCGNESVTSLGGGVYFTTAGSHVLTMSNTIVSCNSVETSGSNPTRQGGGVYVNAGTASVTNCTVVRNSTHGIHRQGGTVSVINSIVFHNGGSQISGTMESVTYSDVEDGYAGEGNKNQGPVFRNDNCSGGNYGIVSVSPLVDCGSPLKEHDDSDGCSRPPYGDARNDMGAHGGPLACWAPEPCHANVNCDEAVDFDDLLVVLDGWGPCPACPCQQCPGDLDSTNEVDFDDMVIVLSRWGPCP